MVPRDNICNSLDFEQDSITSAKTHEEIVKMIEEIKGYKLLTGYRGQAPVNISALEDMLLAVSDFVENNSEIKEIDLNPVIASSEGTIAVDVRIVLEE